jgi:hypothetical protein
VPLRGVRFRRSLPSASQSLSWPISEPALQSQSRIRIRLTNIFEATRSHQCTETYIILVGKEKVMGVTDGVKRKTTVFGHGCRRMRRVARLVWGVGINLLLDADIRKASLCVEPRSYEPLIRGGAWLIGRLSINTVRIWILV